MKIKTTMLALLLMAATATQSVGQEGTVINGLEWANTNVAQPNTFAVKPDTITEYYPWNSIVPYTAQSFSLPGQNFSPTWTVNPCPDGWRLPTAGELLTLSNVGSTWAEVDAKDNDFEGRFYGYNHATATIDNPQGCIFLSALGYRQQGRTGVPGWKTDGRYWSSQEYMNTIEYCLHFSSTYSGLNTGSHLRIVVTNNYCVMSVRCVRTPDVTIEVTDVSLNKTIAVLFAGGTEQLNPYFTPSNAANQNVTWSSSNTSVATVSSAGLVTALAEGTATITVTTADGNKTAECAVAVVATTSLNGVEWAKTNLTTRGMFAARADTFTHFYQWNRNEQWDATTGGIMAGWNSTTEAATKWATDPCPTGWRLPTQAEFQGLNAEGSSWANAYDRGNEVEGRFYGENNETCTLPDNMADCIFLPASGMRRNNNGLLTNQSYNGYYWSSEQLNTTTGRLLNFDEWSDNVGTIHKAIACNIRCVYDPVATTQNSYSVTLAQTDNYNAAAQMRMMNEDIEALHKAEHAATALLYPNPATNGEVTIDNGEVEIGEVIVLNSNGAVVRRQDFGNQTVGTLLLHGLQGTYYVRIGKTTQSIIVVN